MPNFDGGHYFYTGFFPVKLDSVKRSDGSYTVPSHLLRETLATLPNFSEASGPLRTSPFARCRSTHLARLAVMDNPAFNGRDPVDALKAALQNVNLHDAQPVDHLSRAWLLFAADFDAVDEGARDRWAAGLWELMEKELREIFGHCEGFDVDGPEAFARYLARGQVETTMSFNDYWIDPPPFPALTKGRIVMTALVPALLAALGAAWLRWRPWHWPHWPWDWGGIALVVLAGIVGLLIGLWLLYSGINRRGAKPFPVAPNSDLKSILKSLYLQQNFVRFAIENQGASPEALHKAFGAFLDRVQPEDVEAPTQPRGVLQA